MSIQVADKIIETDEEGYLIDPNDWSEAVAEAMAARQSQQEHVELSETQLGLVQYFREYFAETQVHPTMHKLDTSWIKGVRSVHLLDYPLESMHVAPVENRISRRLVPCDEPRRRIPEHLWG
jgi:TusE/DsrC/DsvC family sulfur relay protein